MGNLNIVSNFAYNYLRICVRILIFCIESEITPHKSDANVLSRSISFGGYDFVALPSLTTVASPIADRAQKVTRSFYYQI